MLRSNSKSLKKKKKGCSGKDLQKRKVYLSGMKQRDIHPFNGPFSGTTQVSRYQKGKTNPNFTEARE